MLSGFFNKVMVNADDEAVRLNRFALLEDLRKLLIAEIADITKLQ